MERHNLIIDNILDIHKVDLGKDFQQYRNHVYRVFNFAIPYILSQEELKTLSIAVAFHDLGIWTHKTFDYLNPSIDLARKYCLDNHIDTEISIEIETIILYHHKLTKIKTSNLAEIFRQADLVDLSFGFIRKSRLRNEIKVIKKHFPNKGFHVNLSLLFLKNLFKKPWNPLPMYKL